MILSSTGLVQSMVKTRAFFLATLAAGFLPTVTAIVSGATNEAGSWEKGRARRGRGGK